MPIDQRVIDHCAAHKLCRGCPLICVAPVSDRDFPAWVEAMSAKVITLIKLRAVDGRHND